MAVLGTTTTAFSMLDPVLTFPATIEVPETSCPVDSVPSMLLSVPIASRVVRGAATASASVMFAARADTADESKEGSFAAPGGSGASNGMFMTPTDTARELMRTIT